jgi:hypothetical protein
MNKRIKAKLAKKQRYVAQGTSVSAAETSGQNEGVQKSVKAGVAELAGEVRELARAIGRMAELEVEKAVAKIPLVGEIAAQQLHRLATKG